MSDTMQEREDQKVDWHEFTPDSNYSIRMCAICGFGEEGHNKYFPPYNQNTRLIGSPNENADWCDDCHGYTHMPWCPAYKEPVKEAVWCPACGTLNCVNPANHQAATSEHQPAARGGGDEWYTDSRRSTDATIYARTGNRWIGQVHAKYADQIVAEHNQHHSLVAERERWERDRKFLGDRLEAQAETMAKLVKERNQYRLALEIIRDSFWSEGEPFEERVEYLQQTAKDILETVQQRRSE